MNKSEAESIIKGIKTFDDVINPESSQTPDNTSDAVETVTETVDESAKSENTSENSSTEGENVAGAGDVYNGPEKVVEDKAQAKERAKKSSKYSQEQKIAHSFQKEKNKRREVQAKLDAKQKEIEELQQKLKKYEGLKLEDFNGDNDAYTEFKIDQKLDSEKVSRLQSEYSQEQMAIQQEEAAQIAEYRLQTNFPEEVERNNYQNLIMRAENDYASMHPEIGYERFSDFLLSEKDRTLISYLQDSDNSPKLIRHFIHKPEVALKIMQMKNPYNKIVELKQLENRMLQYERVQSAKNKKLETKRELPNTGKVVTTSTINNGVDWSKPFSKQDAVNYFKNKNKH